MGGLINEYGQYIFIVMGLVCIVKGIITLTTGKIPEREMMKLDEFSENGLKKYKMLSSVMNIVGGLFCIAISVVKMLQLVDPFIFKIAAIVILIGMVVVYIVIRNSCKKAE